jgi:hypothetical protein
MDGSRFDALTRALAEPASRRRLLGGLAGAISSAVLAAVGLDPEDAAAKKKCRANGDKCRKGNQCCSGRCKDHICVKKRRDEGECRRDRDCPDDGDPCTAAVCDNQQCTTVRLGPDVQCGENAYCDGDICRSCDLAGGPLCRDPSGEFRCATLDQDPLHCGACGYACAEGEVCFRSECIPDSVGTPCEIHEECGPEPGKRCFVDSNTGEGMCCDAAATGIYPAHCDDACVDLYYDANHCGACRHRCDIEHGEICYETGCCVPRGNTCEEGQRCCRGGLGGLPCNNNFDCGVCGRSCGEGEVCDRGACVPDPQLEGAPCTAEADCGPPSLDLMCLTDPNTGEGACCRTNPGAEDYFVYCDGVWTNRYDDPNNCGACRTVCDTERGEVCSDTSCCVPEGNACEADQQCCQSGHTCFEGRCQLTG